MAKLIHLVDGIVTNEFELGTEGLSIGRAAHNDVQIDDLAVSAVHAVVRPAGDGTYSIEDRDSTNGTYINERRIARHVLEPNDQLRIGWTAFKFVDAVEPEPEKTARVRKTWLPGVYVTKKD